MKKIFLACMILMFYGCKKDTKVIAPETTDVNFPFTKYTILKGQHYCDKSVLKSFAGSHLNFRVKFDSSAIYQTIDPVNQYDINKLYGFSEGANHHENSARIGWSWNRSALRLYAYAYSKSVREMKEITSVAIGDEIACSIGIKGDQYVFSVGRASIKLKRAIEGEAIAGYQLYPYFGGDEVASHNIFIYIEDTKKQ